MHLLHRLQITLQFMQIKFQIIVFYLYMIQTQQNILNYIRTSSESDGEKFRKMCQHFDLLRNQNFSDSHPEIAHAMGYSK